MEDIGRYKSEALPKVKEQIERFRELADRGEAALAEMERRDR